MKRRGRGEGSIYKTSDATWKSCVNLGLTPQGKRDRIYFSGQTKKEVQDKLSTFHAKSVTGSFVRPSRLTVSGYLEHWLSNDAQSSVRPTTFRSYSGIVRNHIVPRIGGVLLDQVSPAHIQKLNGEVKRSGASDRLSELVYVVANRAFGQAERQNLIQKNPCRGVNKPRVPRKTMQTLSEEQARLFLDEARGDRLYALYALAVTTGLRQGELFALHWADIDLEARMIHVRHTLQEYGSELTLAEPKTNRSRRSVDISDRVVAALRTHHKKMMIDGNPGPWVFCDLNGGPLRKSNVTRRSFRPLLKKAELPTIRFHDLCHTAATLWLIKGIHPKVVQERLGHSNIAITLDTYSHVLPSMQRDAAERLDDLLAEA